MSTPTGDHFDWDKYEAEIGVGGNADVVDLDKARQRRDHTDQEPDSDDGPVLVDSVAAQRRPRPARRRPASG